MLAYRELLMCYAIACWQERLAFRQQEVDVQHDLLFLINLIEMIGKLQFSLALRDNSRQLHCSLLYGQAVGHECPTQFLVSKRAEEVFVLHPYASIRQVSRSHPDVLVEILHLVGMGIGLAVGTEQTVAIEVVVRRVVAVIVAAVKVGPRSTQPLVSKIPNEATLELRIAAHQVPIFLETAHGVTHSVGVLT